MDWNLLKDKARPFLMVLLAPLVPLVAAWLNATFGIVLDEAAQARLLEHAVDFAILATIAGIAKVSGNKKVNPGNAATTTLAATEKQLEKDLKSMDSSDNGSPAGLPSPALRPNVAGSDPDQDRTGRL